MVFRHWHGHEPGCHLSIKKLCAKSRWVPVKRGVQGGQSWRLSLRRMRTASPPWVAHYPGPHPSVLIICLLCYIVFIFSIYWGHIPQRINMDGADDTIPSRAAQVHAEARCLRKLNLPTSSQDCLRPSENARMICMCVLWHHMAPIQTAKTGMAQAVQ